MRRSTLAKQLVAAKDDRERRALLRVHSRSVDAGLSDELLAICYATWMSEPATAQKASRAAREVAKANGSDRSRAVAAWIDGVAKITLGKFEAAISSLNDASDRLTLLGNDAEAAQTRVAKLIAYGMLGQYDEALHEGRTALAGFVRSGDQLSAGKIELNMSNILSRRARHRDAIKLCRSARRRFAGVNETRWVALAENGLANSYMELGEMSRAETSYAGALRTATSAGMDVTVAEIEASLGNLATIRNRYSDALRLLESSRERYERIGMPHQSAIADLEVADLYAGLNLLVEARDAYTRVSGAFRSLGLRGEEARALLGLAGVELANGDTKDARRHLQRSRELFERERNTAGKLDVMIAAARLELLSGGKGSAGPISSIVGPLDKDLRRKEVDLLLVESEQALARGDSAKAQQHARRAARLAAARSDHDKSRAAETLLGEIAMRAGRRTAAIQAFERAVSHTEQLTREFSAEQFQVNFARGKTTPYERLTAIYLADGDLDKAFDMAERGRARALSAALAAGSRSHADQRVVEMRNELNWLYRRLELAAADERVDLAAKIADREKQINVHRLRAASLSAVTKSDAFGSGLLRRVQAKLAARTLVEFIESDGVLSAIIVSSRGVRMARDLVRSAEVGSLLDGLRLQFGTLRYGTALPQAFQEAARVRADAVLEKLYDAILGPVLSPNDRDLVVVPAGILNYIPFAALRSGGAYLVEGREISVVPSASVWLGLRDRPVSGTSEALLVAPTDATIPNAAAEVAGIARKFNRATRLTGAKATSAAFLDEAPRHDLLHLACHGEFRVDNPAFSNLRLADGRVTMQDISELDLKAALVTLSACETGVSEVRAGEEIVGLARGFLSAGASSVLVSLWNVNDGSTARLMLRLYEAVQRGGRPASSLRQAQISLIRDGLHPYHWAAFVLIGK